jgi:hypothetical protein
MAFGAGHSPGAGEVLVTGALKIPCSEPGEQHSSTQGRTAAN